jgi:AcrR family transcriptional regulator
MDAMSKWNSTIHEAQVTTKSRRRSQAQRREDSKARILAAAIDLVNEKGFDRFSLQDIGQAAKCSHELVNFYFGSKDGLLTELATHIIGNISDELRSFNEEPDGFENFALEIRYVATVADRNMKTFSAYMRAAGEAPFRESLIQLFRDRRSQTVSIFRDSIIAGQASGGIRRNVDADKIAEVTYDFVRGNADRRQLDRGAKYATRFGVIVETFIELLRNQISVGKRTAKPTPPGHGKKSDGRVRRDGPKSPRRRSISGLHSSDTRR